MAMADLQEEFTRALESHLADGGEAALLFAYELGRRTLAARFGVLDVATPAARSPVGRLSPPAGRQRDGRPGSG